MECFARQSEGSREEIEKEEGKETWHSKSLEATTKATDNSFESDAGKDEGKRKKALSWVLEEFYEIIYSNSFQNK